MNAPIQKRNIRPYLGILLAGMLTACAPTPPPPAVQAEKVRIPADFPEARYLEARSLGKEVFRIDSARSLVIIEVHRAGALARLGHEHVVASHDVSGYVSADEGLSDIYVPLEKLAVDEPALRTEAGLETQPSPENIEGTRRNMLETLDAEQFPFALVHATLGDPNRRTLNVSIELHGMTRTYEVPVQLVSAHGELVVEGKMSLNQTDFGIAPFSVLGGALRVEDRLDLRFYILAQRI